MDGWMYIWMDGWMDEWMDEWMDACMYLCMYKWMDGWMHGSMDGWINGCIGKPFKGISLATFVAWQSSNKKSVPYTFLKKGQNSQGGILTCLMWTGSPPTRTLLGNRFLNK